MGVLGLYALAKKKRGLLSIFAGVLLLIVLLELVVGCTILVFKVKKNIYMKILIRDCSLCTGAVGEPEILRVGATYFWQDADGERATNFLCEKLKKTNISRGATSFWRPRKNLLSSHTPLPINNEPSLT